MAEPKQKMSRARSRRRRGQQQPATMAVGTCPTCKRPVARHRVCPSCLDGHLEGKKE